MRAFVATSMLLAGCAAGAAPPPRGHVATQADLVATLRADPPAVLDAAARALRGRGFQIESADSARALVRTSEIVVAGTWGDADVPAYLYCGRDWRTGAEHASSQPLRVRISVVMRQQDLGATLVRIDVDAHAAGPGDETHDCRPTTRLARELVAEIRAAL